tara:strand:- start:221 stop:421 length:201 start_codon:yes stop_codon:yes gene_type:complete
MLIFKNTNVAGVFSYQLSGKDKDELSRWKKDFLSRYERGYGGTCSTPIKKWDDKYIMHASRWPSCE